MTFYCNEPIGPDGIRAVMARRVPRRSNRFLLIVFAVALMYLVGHLVCWAAAEDPGIETTWGERLVIHVDDSPPVEDLEAPIILHMIATAYTPECGNGDGVTATGSIPRPGVAAVDPSVIPLGTELHIEGYGYARAEDTGGVIKGDKIDVFFPSRGEALRWGKRAVEVQILN
ncbi:MAG: 3D domain-containing protein [Eubacteriales bacterium]|nr:3D domain-containing protein [Clostridia bacterium]MDZ4042891.1 3D domain-containing protein [Eubacteriales bacterium]